MTDPRAGNSARALREAFDRSFAEATEEKHRTTSLLSIRIGGDPYGLRLDEVLGLYRDRPITHAPSRLPELLGMAGFRGTIAPVYDLGALLGYERARTPRWLVLVRGRTPVALAFEVFEAHLKVEPDRLSSTLATSTRSHLVGALSEAGEHRALIHLASIVEAIASRARSRAQ